MNVLSEKTEYEWPHWVQSNLEKITDSESLKNDSSRVVDEGPKGATRGGEWEPIKISCKRKLRLSPKAHTQPKRPRHIME